MMEIILTLVGIVAVLLLVNGALDWDRDRFVKNLHKKLDEEDDDYGNWR